MRRTVPAVFARGGTSKGLIFLASDLPDGRAVRDAMFLRAMGSPDPAGRQLNGMGGGLSSLSKVCIVAPSDRQDADVDYTFVQVQVRDAMVDYSGNCGNMASAIGPFAVETGLIDAPDGVLTVRIHNTNTSKIIRSTFEVRDGQAVEDGDLVIPGVSGSGAPIRLDFLSPGGATTGRVLPGGSASSILETSFGPVEVSLVDAGNACAFVPAASVGAHGTESPEYIDGSAELCARLREIRELASVAMGITPDVDAARRKMLVPLVAMVSPAADFTDLSGQRVHAENVDVTIRMISNGQAHRAIPMTGAVCVAVAAEIEDTVVHRARRAPGGDLRIGMPSGVLTVAAEVRRDGSNGWHAASGAIYRTTRQLFRGEVSVR